MTRWIDQGTSQLCITCITKAGHWRVTSAVRESSWVCLPEGRAHVWGIHERHQVCREVDRQCRATMSALGIIFSYRFANISSFTLSHNFSSIANAFLFCFSYRWTWPSRFFRQRTCVASRMSCIFTTCTISHSLSPEIPSFGSILLPAVLLDPAFLLYAILVTPSSPYANQFSTLKRLGLQWM